VIYLVAQEMAGKSTEPAANVSGESSSTTGPEQASATATPDEKEEKLSKVVVYYFHGNVRCVTCRTIEAYAKEAVESEFGDALADGRLEWQTVNVEVSGNRHFIKDFQLTTRSVVLERLQSGKRRDWKNLSRVWELAGGEKAEFIKYVQGEVKACLEAAGT